jgi:hypothetical protein
MKKLFRSLVRNESGQGVLLTVLILLALGAILTVPLLSLMSTGLEAGRLHEEKTDKFYAADAGVEDAMYKIKYNLLPDWMQGVWGEYAYSHDPYEYSIEPEINGKNTKVVIQPIWVLEGLETLKPGQRREPHDDLVTVGDVRAPGEYQVTIIRSEDFPGDLKLVRIGCWLPGGVEYINGSSNLEEDPTEPYYCVPQTFDHNGGTAITWDFAPAISYDELPGSTNQKVVTLNFTPEEEVGLQGSFSWTRTNRNDIYLSWDVDTKLYKITSTATDPVTNTLTTVTAYTSKNEFRKLGSAISGDYEATGNTWMRNADGDSLDRRERLYEETSATISNIPDGATVEKIFLYWSGWQSSPWNVWGMTEEQRQALPSDYIVNEVQLKVEVPGAPADVFNEMVTASLSQVLPNGNPGSPHGWSYSCLIDVTDLLKDFFADNDVDFVGNATYTVGHAHLSGSGTPLYYWKDNHYKEPVVARTHYPLGSPYDSYGDQDEWSYAGWSVVVIYTSPQTEGHQLYIYDTFRYCDNAQTLNFTIKNFLAPQDVIDDPEAARITCFVGEGDSIYGAGNYEDYCWSHYHVHDWDCLKLNGYYLSDLINPWNNVWNSQSNVMPGLSIDGIDIDTFSAGYPIIKPGDNIAQVELPTGVDSWNLVYIILSFRSETTTGGLLTYEIEAG